jgi:hypothetical protein
MLSNFIKNNNMKKTKNFMMMAGIVLALFSCKKDDLGALGGETDIPLTKVGSETSIYPSLGSYDFPTATAVITQNDNGNVTYKLKLDIDLAGNPDSAVIASVIKYVKDEGIITVDGNGLIDLGFQLRITSEGYQVISEDNKPQTIVKYGDPVGTQYSFNTIYTDKKVIGTVTEKTGLDDWPIGFLNIKTSKVDFQYPTEVPFVDKIVIRANHKFGIVYLEIKFKGVVTPAKIDLIPWFLL